MRFTMKPTLFLLLLPLCACTGPKPKELPPPPVVPKSVLVVPVGKNWEVKEEAPTLTNERHERTLPFQTEQSVQPPVAQPVPPTEQRKIETPR